MDIRDHSGFADPIARVVVREMAFVLVLRAHSRICCFIAVTAKWSEQWESLPVAGVARMSRRRVIRSRTFCRASAWSALQARGNDMHEMWRTVGVRPPERSAL